MRNVSVEKAGGLFSLVCLTALIGAACQQPPAGPSVPPPGSDAQGTQPHELLLASGQSLVAGGSHTCAILVGGAVKCWGENTWGQLGRNGTIFGPDQHQGDPLQDQYVDLGAGRTAKALAAGTEHTCALLDTNQIKCWGHNEDGRLGQGDNVDRGRDDVPGTLGDALPPINLGTGRTALAVVAGGTKTCALLDTHQAKCWGSGYSGQLGYGDFNDRGVGPAQMGDYLPTIDLGTGRTVTALAATKYLSTCAILDNGHVRCWGLNQACTLGDDPAPQRGKNPGEMGDNMPDINIGPSPRIATQIVAGWDFLCALRDDGQVKCWGEDDYGQMGVGQVKGGWGCLSSEMGDGTNGANLLKPFGAGIAVTALAAGDKHACAMRANGEVRCWGNNGTTAFPPTLVGQLGINSGTIPAQSTTPWPTSIPGVTARGLTAGGFHTCAITTANKARCWGMNESGQLGTNIGDTRVGDVVGEISATANSDLGTRQVWQTVSGGYHACAILGAGPTGAVKCWGDNTEGQLGVGDTSVRGDDPGEMGNSLPTLVLGSGRSGKWLAAAFHTSCAVLDNNTLKCWGGNSAGQLGMGNFTQLTSPSSTAINLGSLRTVHSTLPSPVAAGVNHTCAILDTSQVKCWGANDNGQLGYGDTTLRNAPAATTIVLGTSRTAKAVAAGDFHTCAILDDNTLKCWGYNGSGQLGDGTTTDRLSPPATPIVLGSGRTAKAVAAGNTHTCALLDNNQIKCWGYNQLGQLGQGDITQRNSPPSTTVDLGTSQSALAIAVGFDYSCALLATNQVKCWGNNSSFQLGTWQDMSSAYDFTVGERANEMGNFLPIVNQGGGRQVRAITAGSAHTCFLLDSNQVRCTGDNSAGQMGQGNTSAYNPIGVPAGLVDLGTDF